MNGDTESNVDTARERAEKLISDGAQLLIGAFNSGQTTAIAQVAEQKGIPFVINLAAAPDITEQGYKFVFRNFPTAIIILGNAFANQKELFATIGAAPKTVVYMHVNNTFGTAMAKGVNAILPKFDMPYTIVEEIPYDPAGARSFRRGGEGQGHQRRRVARHQSAQRLDPDNARAGQAAVDAAGDSEHGTRLVSRISISRRWASSPTVR